MGPEDAKGPDSWIKCLTAWCVLCSGGKELGLSRLSLEGLRGLDFWDPGLWKNQFLSWGWRGLGQQMMRSWGLDSWVHECLVPLGEPGELVTWLERLHFLPWTCPRWGSEAGSLPFPHSPGPGRASPRPHRGSHRPGFRRRAARAEAAAIVAATAVAAVGPGSGPDRAWRGWRAPCLGPRALKSLALPPCSARPQR